MTCGSWSSHSGLSWLCIDSALFSGSPPVQWFLSKLIGDALIYAEHGRRKRVSEEDVDKALKNNGIKLFGLSGEDRLHFMLLE